MHFFDRFPAGGFTGADVDRYRSLFPRPPGQITGEWTPRYMHDFWTPRLLRSAAPAARLLVMLRDPIERYRSGMTRETSAADDAGTHVASKAWTDAMGRSQYCAQLLRLLEHFPRDQVLVLQHERCTEYPEEELRRTYEFLGVEPLDHVPLEPNARVGPRSPKADLPSELRADLVAALRPDVEELGRRFAEVDIDLWPDFRDAK